MSIIPHSQSYSERPVAGTQTAHKAGAGDGGVDAFGQSSFTEPGTQSCHRKLSGAVGMGLQPGREQFAFEGYVEELPNVFLIRYALRFRESPRDREIGRVQPDYGGVRLGCER